MQNKTKGLVPVVLTTLLAIGTAGSTKASLDEHYNPSEELISSQKISQEESFLEKYSELLLYSACGVVLLGFGAEIYFMERNGGGIPSGNPGY